MCVCLAIAIYAVCGAVVGRVRVAALTTRYRYCYYHQFHTHTQTNLRNT